MVVDSYVISITKFGYFFFNCRYLKVASRLNEHENGMCSPIVKKKKKILMNFKCG